VATSATTRRCCLRVDGEQEKNHERVVMTRWWLQWPASSWKRKEDPPTSCNDSLVVVVAGVVVDSVWKSGPVRSFDPERGGLRPRPVF
jgi:hypothetical protein